MVRDGALQPLWTARKGDHCCRQEMIEPASGRMQPRNDVSAPEDRGRREGSMPGQAQVIQATLDRFDERYGELRLVRPRAEAVLRESMGQLGQLVPLVATEREGTLVVIDGFKRLHAARKLALEVLEVRLLELSETAAVAAVYGLNRHGRGISDFEQALVVQALCRGQGMSQTEVAVLLGHHKSWVCRRLALIERLDSQVQQDLRVGLVSPSVVRELVRLPRGNQGEVAQAVFHHGLTVRDAALLVTLFEQAGDRHRQQALLSAPAAALERARGRPAVAAYDPRLSVEDNRLRRAVLRLLDSQTRLDQSLASAATDSWTEPQRAALCPLLTRAREQGAALLAALDAAVVAPQEVDDVRQ